ncbi:MAG: hypothetical protein SGJ13_05190, partial [Actinomycetota bacterium]|nr:hypothetical protein [Actinomycetota bacterium]
MTGAVGAGVAGVDGGDVVGGGADVTGGGGTTVVTSGGTVVSPGGTSLVVGGTVSSEMKSRVNSRPCSVTRWPVGHNFSSG